MSHILNHVITTLSSTKLIILGTLLVLLGSIPIVYIASYIGGVEYSGFLLTISIVLPLLLTPTAISTVIKLSMNLEHVKEHLANEIEKNKVKDVLIYEQSRFALMGEMLANISHQWKQPLNTINLAVINVRMNLSDEEKRERNFDIIEDNVNHLASTINDFMSYFDKRKHSEVRDLENIVTEIKSIANTSINNSGAKLFIELNEENKKIKIASSISQILLNLINNAKDALLNVEGSKEIKVTFIIKSQECIISCCDNGVGISPAIKEQIFNPYFTTKSHSTGTGIGLYMSRQIIDKFFNGEIVLESKNNYTCFKVIIPFGKNCYIEDTNYDT